MSFYAGPVARLTQIDDTIWKVLSVHYLDTNCDENIQTDFTYKSVKRIIILPVTLIKDFDTNTTKTVNRTFDSESCTEHWEALT